MAAASNIKPYHSLFLLFFFTSALLTAPYAAPQGRPRGHHHHHHQQQLLRLPHHLVKSSETAMPQEDMLLMTQEGKKGGIRGRNGGRRLMIGSTAPICSYNECRGCKHKCSAEQVPVDGNDPINSAYRYKCVCHRS